MNKILKSRVKIRFQDCDPFNHLNNAKYIDYFLNAREDQIHDSYNFDIFKNIKDKGTSWVVYSTQIAYLKPVNTNQTVIIETKLLDFSDKSIQVEMIMKIDDNTINSVLWVTFVHFNLKEQKPTNHFKEHTQLFTKIKYPIQEQSFEKRIKNLKQTK